MDKIYCFRGFIPIESGAPAALTLKDEGFPVEEIEKL
jgi:hypothetical protein